MSSAAEKQVPPASSAAGAELRVYLLGKFLVTVGDRPVEDSAWRLRKAKSLVKLLALSPGHRLHREQAMDLLWPDLDPEAAANNLHKTLHVARRALEPYLTPDTPSAYLRLHEDQLALQAPGGLWVDAEAFRSAAQTARRSREPDAYENALNLYHGDLLPSDPYEDWAATQRDELQELCITLLLELAEARDERGELSQAIDALRRAVVRDPAREDAHVRLMRLYALSGQRHQALRQFDQLRKALRRELEVDPEPSSQQLYEHILSGRFSPEGRVARAGHAEAQWQAPPARSQVPTLQPHVAGAQALVGRDKQTEQLDQALDALFAGRSGLVLFAGEAGVGKSRLAEEAAERTRQRGGIALVGSGHEQEGRLPYGPFVEMLDALPRLLPPADLHAVVADAGQMLARLAPTMGRVVAHDGSSGGSEDRQRWFAAVSGVLARLAALAPVLIVVDDLHAVDEGSLQLLHYIVRTATQSRLLFIATFRPEEADPELPLGQFLAAVQREHRATRLDLGRLPQIESERLVAALLSDAPVDRAVFDAIYGLAAGNPFYTHEAVRVLRESAGLELSNGRWELMAHSEAAPSPLVDLVAARLHRLRPATRQMLNVAAVVGWESPYPLLRAAAEWSESDLLDALDECLARRIIEESAEGYRFSHPLYRAAVYERMSRARRTALHDRVAQAIESLQPEGASGRVEALAYHHARGEAPERAVPYLVASGDRAAAIHAHESAIAAYRQAIDLLPLPGAAPGTRDLIAELWEKVGDHHALLGETGAEIEAYERAIAVSSNQPVLGRLHRKSAQVLLARQQDASDIDGHLLAAEQALTGQAGEAERVRLRALQAHWLWNQGRYPEALEAAEESLVFAEESGDQAALADAYAALALVFHSSGEWKQGLQFEIQHLGASTEDPQVALHFDLHL